MNIKHVGIVNKSDMWALILRHGGRLELLYARLGHFCLQSILLRTDIFNFQTSLWKNQSV